MVGKCEKFIMCSLGKSLNLKVLFVFFVFVFFSGIQSESGIQLSAGLVHGEVGKKTSRRRTIYYGN